MKINRRNADQQILRDYQELRNERRSNTWLMPLALIGKLLPLVAITVIMLLDLSTTTKVNALLIVFGGYLVAFFGIFIWWQPRGDRFKAAGAVVALVAFVGIVVYVMQDVFGI